MFYMYQETIYFTFVKTQLMYRHFINSSQFVGALIVTTQ